MRVQLESYRIRVIASKIQKGGLDFNCELMHSKLYDSTAYPTLAGSDRPMQFNPCHCRGGGQVESDDFAIGTLWCPPVR